MTDRKNSFEKDIDVPHEEQIIIDGVDVSECIFLDIVNERLWCDNVNISAIGKSQCPYVDCFKNPDCYYKQLVRKTAECEELKEYIQANQPTGICETCMAKAILQNDKYRKALEEIEELISDDSFKICPIDDSENCNYFTSRKILDIINKTKEG